LQSAVRQGALARGYLLHGRSLGDDMFYSEVGESLSTVGNLPYSCGCQALLLFHP
jgi:hypothetical protein